MPRRRIDRFLNETLETFSLWLKDHPEWRGKESECVNLFAHKFLFEKIEAGAAIECPTQVGIASRCLYQVCATGRPKATEAIQAARFQQGSRDLVQGTPDDVVGDLGTNSLAEGRHRVEGLPATVPRTALPQAR